MYNYSDISLGKLEEDLKNTFEECKVLVSNIKSSEDIDLSKFNELESTVYDLSGRIAFMGDVHPDENIRDFGNEADSKIQNLALLQRPKVEEHFEMKMKSLLQQHLVLLMMPL